MNYRMVFYLLGQMMRVEGLLMLLPLVCTWIYHEDTLTAFQSRLFCWSRSVRC